MALLHGTSKYTWKKRQVELADLPEGTVVKAVRISVSFQTKKMKDNFLINLICV
jgi:hypothetical protein